MPEPLPYPLETYVMAFFKQAPSFPVMLFCVALFTHGMRRRPRFHLRFLAGMLLIFAGFVLTAVLRADFPGMATRILANLFSYFAALPLLLLCYAERLSDLLLNWCAGVAAQEIGSRGYYFLLTLAGVDTQRSISLFPQPNLLRDFGLQYIFCFLVGFLCWRLFRENRQMDADDAGARSILALSVFSAFFMAISNSVAREFQSESAALYLFLQISSMIFSAFVLSLRTGILTQNRYRHEIALMEQVLREERKQYQSSKENIDIINMKCHDLKRQLSGLSDKLTAQEISTLQEAISIYDSNIRTGSEVLDVLMYEKQLICRKEGIRLTCMADGKALSFMRTAHLYALLNNALDNALEAVRKLDEPEKRVVDLSVARDGGAVDILVSNYFQADPSMRGGLPLATTKADKNHHGFGLKSMNYVVRQYGGSLETSAEGPIFLLKIRIPFPNRA